MTLKGSLGGVPHCLASLILTPLDPLIINGTDTITCDSCHCFETGSKQHVLDLKQNEDFKQQLFPKFSLLCFYAVPIHSEVGFYPLGGLPFKLILHKPLLTCISAVIEG